MKKTILAILLCLSMVSVFAYEIYSVECNLDPETEHCVLNATTSVGDIQVYGIEEIKEFTNQQIYDYSRMKLIQAWYNSWGYGYSCAGRVLTVWNQQEK